MKKTMIGLVAVLFFGSCTQVEGWFGSGSEADSTQQQLKSEGAYKAKRLRDESITRENAYSDLFLSGGALDSFLKRNSIGDDAAERMREFYLVRNDEFAWFTSSGLTEQARAFWGLYAGETQGKEGPAARIRQRMDSLVANDSLFFQRVDTALRDDPSEAGLAQARAAADSVPLNTELTLTAQMVQMASENGGVVTEENMYWLVPRKKMGALQLADSLLHKQPDSSLGQNNPQYAALKKALHPYCDAVKAGGWQPLTAKGLKKGTKSPAVAQLKRRLAASGDYSKTDTSALFTDSLTAAIKTVQEQFGLLPTGVVNDSLLAELNVPAQERLQQILLNLNRSLWVKPAADSHHIAVNIPSLKLVVYTDSGRTLQMPVVVGKEGTGTVAFGGEISQVVFSPYWNIPESIVRDEIKPAMEKDPAYLKKRHMEIVKQSDSLPQIRQLPGAGNALGRVKFLFPNSFDIYLHDTPNKEIFAQQNRAVSHGCIRVAQPDLLAQFLLRKQPGWTPEKIAAAMNAGQEQKVDVKSPTPVVITYYTAWSDERGRLNFRRDVYGYDRKTASRMFANAAMPAAA